MIFEYERVISSILIGDTLPVALILPAVIKPLGINSMCMLEIKELDGLRLSCAQAPPIKLFV